MWLPGRPISQVTPAITGRVNFSRALPPCARLYPPAPAGPVNFQQTPCSRLYGRGGGTRWRNPVGRGGRRWSGAQSSGPAGHARIPRANGYGPDANSGAAPGTGAAPLSAAGPARTPGGYSSNLRRKRSSIRSVNPPERRGRPRPPVARSDDPEPAESLGAPPPRPGVAPLAPPSRSSTPAPNITMNPIRLMIGKPPGRTGRAIPATSRTRPSMNKAAAWSRRRLEAVRRRPPRTDDANFGSSA